MKNLRFYYMLLIFSANKKIKREKKCITITNDFQFLMSDRKPNKAWVDENSSFYHRSMKLWLQDNNIEIFSSLNERKSVATERFVRTLKNKIYIDKLDNK